MYVLIINNHEKRLTTTFVLTWLLKRMKVIGTMLDINNSAAGTVSTNMNSACPSVTIYGGGIALPSFYTHTHTDNKNRVYTHCTIDR